MAFLKYKEYSVRDLVDLIKEGDKTAFGEVYDRYAKTIYNKCISFTHDREEAEDITQDIFVKVYDKLKTFDNRNFGSWLMRITYNQCVDYSRKSNKNRTVQESFENLEIEDTESDLEAELMDIKLSALEKILKEINPIDRSLLILKYQEDNKIDDLAKLFELSHSAIKMRLSRARQLVIEKYKSEYHE